MLDSSRDSYTMIHILNKHVLFRYIVSGGTSASVLLTLLYIFNSVLGIQYLLAAILAYIVAFFVSFTLHKIWTFKTDEVHKTHNQVALYLVTSLFGLSFNTLLMYIFVDIIYIPVILSQIFAGAIVACFSFFLSRKFVFKWKQKA